VRARGNGHADVAHAPADRELHALVNVAVDKRQVDVLDR